MGKDIWKKCNILKEEPYIAIAVLQKIT